MKLDRRMVEPEPRHITIRIATPEMGRAQYVSAMAVVTHLVGHRFHCVTTRADDSWEIFGEGILLENGVVWYRLDRRDPIPPEKRALIYTSAIVAGRRSERSFGSDSVWADLEAKVERALLSYQVREGILYSIQVDRTTRAGGGEILTWCRDAISAVEVALNEREELTEAEVIEIIDQHRPEGQPAGEFARRMLAPPTGQEAADLEAVAALVQWHSSEPEETAAA